MIALIVLATFVRFEMPGGALDRLELEVAVAGVARSATAGGVMDGQR